MSQANSTRKPWRRRVHRPGLILAGTLSALIALGSTSAMAYLVYLQRGLHISTVDVTDPVPNTPQTILILGSDSRAGLSPAEQARKGKPGEVPGHRSDTIILMRIDPRNGKTVVVHFPRDLMVPIAGTGKVDRINTAFEKGPQRMVDTIEQYSGLTINHYVEVDFGGFENIVNAMGGVPICVDKPLYDQLAELNLPKAGCYLLGGHMALAFVRARHVEGDVIPDFSRIARQQQFFRAVLNKILAPSSVLRLPSLANAVIGNITVDKGIKVLDINAIAHKLQGLGTPNVDFRVVPSTPVAGQGYLEPIQNLADELFARLKDGKPLGKVGLEIGQYTNQYAEISVRVMDAGGDLTIVHDRLAQGGFEVEPTIPAPAGTTVSKILYAPGREQAAAAVASFLAGLFHLNQLPVEPAPKGSLHDAAIGIVVASDFGEPVRRL